MQPRTLTEILLRSLQRHRRAEHFGFKSEGRWRTISSLGILERARILAGSLARAGIGHGDRVAIISPTRYEWALCDYAAHLLRAVVVPIYPTLTGAQMAFIVQHSGARLAFVGGSEEWTRLASVRGRLTDLETVVSFDPVRAEGAPPSFEEFCAASGPFREYGPFPEDLASILYTSGTTGEPKGVLLTHSNIAANVVACTAALPFTPNDLQLSFLPLSHIFERMVHYYMLWNGVSIWFAEDMGKLKENLLEVRPTILIAVPRVLEKVLESVENEARRGDGLRPRLVRFAIDTARAWTRSMWTTGEVPIWLGLKHLAADRLVLARVREKLGGRVDTIVTGGAATPGAVTEFFNGAGLRFLPGYGLTESSPVIAFNTHAHHALDTVGRPIPGVEVRIAEDGEILTRSECVMQGYYKNEEATQAALDPDGWLHTGDIGELDERGFLRITDRKKDLIVTAGGKKVAPQPIEQALGQDPYVSQVVLVGDTRPYLAALIVPRFTALEEWARVRGIPAIDRGALLGHPEVLALYQDRIDRVCQSLARFETIKRFRLLERELSEAGGELTPTLKVKRRAVAERYRDQIEGLYA